jgi:hypothetical protein
MPCMLSTRTACLPDLADSETVGRPAALSAATAPFNGCAALAYRLTSPVPLSRLCVKHLRAALGPWSPLSLRSGRPCLPTAEQQTM